MKEEPLSPLDQPWVKKRFLNLPQVYQQFGTEMRSASELMEQGAKKQPMVWWHLERAHILSQASAWRHFAVHFSMFGAAIACRDFREVVAQIPRLILAIPSSLLGSDPIGNTGRANVGMFTKMNVPRDFEKLFK